MIGISINEALGIILTTEKDYLDFGFHKVEDQDLAKICQNLLENPDIKTIGLWRNYITDEGVLHIVKMLTSPFCVINHIKLSNNQITKKGVQALLHILPQLKRNIIIELEGNPGFDCHAETYLHWRRPDHLCR
jgi:Ran GTPase-activating protein (RanGAP) involved in mRNA processing and transport